MENLDANLGAARESRLWRAMSWSLGIAIGMVFLKMGAYFITGSAAILSDAAEAIVHVVAVLFATYSLRLSSKPADATHRYGHAKIGFFSAGVEGSLILLVAFYIYFHSGKKLIYPEPVENLAIGIVLTIVAAGISGALGLYLIRTGRKDHSLVVEVNGKYTLADCWQSRRHELGRVSPGFPGRRVAQRCSSHCHGNRANAGSQYSVRCEGYHPFRERARSRHHSSSGRLRTANDSDRQRIEERNSDPRQNNFRRPGGAIGRAVRPGPPDPMQMNVNNSALSFAGVRYLASAA